MQWITLAAIPVIIAMAAITLHFRRIAFTIVLRDGKARVARGEPPEGFVIDVQRIADFSGIQRGTIHGCRASGRKITLRFRGINRANQWQFINAWRNPI